MTVLVALTPGERGWAALHLGAVLARSAHERIVVAAVVPTPWPPSPFLGEAEYLAHVEHAAEQALARARSQLGAGAEAEFVLQHARSVAAGLLEVIADHDADLVVLGSSSEGLLGRVGLGSVAHRVLHGTSVPVVLAPRGFPASDVRITRVTAAFGPRDGDSDLLLRARTVAESYAATLRIASFAIRPTSAFVGSIEGSADDLVVGKWAEQIGGMVSAALARSPGGSVAPAVETVIGQGYSWPEAIGAVSWANGDLLVVGSSGSTMSNFLLGSHASKIVRNSPVPVYLGRPHGSGTAPGRPVEPTPA